MEEKKYRDLNDHFVQKEQEMQQQALKIGQELSKKHTELNRCTRELVAARNDNIRLQEELNSQQLELQSTLSQLAAARSQGLTQQEEYGRLQAKLRQCQRDLSSAREHGGHWQEQVQQQQSELNRSSKDLRSAQREILDLKRQVRWGGIQHSPFLGGQSTSHVSEDAWQEPQRAGSGTVVKGSLLLSSTEGPAHMTGLEGMESGIHSATQSLCQMKAEVCFPQAVSLQCNVFVNVNCVYVSLYAYICRCVQLLCIACVQLMGSEYKYQKVIVNSLMSKIQLVINVLNSRTFRTVGLCQLLASMLCCSYEHLAKTFGT